MVRHALLTAAVVVAVCSIGLAEPPPDFVLNVQNGAGAVATVALPRGYADKLGNAWHVQIGGWIDQQNAQGQVSQMSLIYVNGDAPNQQKTAVRQDAKTGELILEGMESHGLSITRRVLFNKDENLARCVDIFHNPQGREQIVTISLSSVFNSGVDSAEFVPDPTRMNRHLANVAQTPANLTAIEVYAGVGAKVGASLSRPNAPNIITATITISVPRGKDVALFHVHKIVPTPQAGGDAQNVGHLLWSVPDAVRRNIVNFSSLMTRAGGMGLPRGALYDVVELRTGDQLRGTLKDSRFELGTFYGPVVVPVENVAGILNLGQFHRTQMLMTTDGQILGGKLKKQTFEIELSSGQVTSIPISQISRVGYRRRPGEPDERVPEKPTVVLATGEQMTIKPLTKNLEVITRYGKLSLKPQQVDSISFENDGGAVPEISLTDGSKFSGLLAPDQLDVVLETANRPVTIPAGALAELQLANKPESDDPAMTFRLINDEVLVGTLSGKLNVETAFDTIVVDVANVHAMTRVEESAQEVQLMLWDGTALGGWLREPELICRLKGGTTVKVPVALLDQCSQPQGKDPPPKPDPGATTRPSTKPVQVP
ncbi:MAG: hypothetical protein JWN24_1643 [Phycisphaerales bacterium]|nr:hypothetical protein [Phycisphaerales bacterium]